MACSAGCPTPGAHRTFGECLRAKALQVADVSAHKFNQNRNRELDAYVDARNAGLQPDSVFAPDVKRAWDITDATGTPYRGDK